VNLKLRSKAENGSLVNRFSTEKKNGPPDEDCAELPAVKEIHEREPRNCPDGFKE
jgi:hypothetical protein